MNSARGKERLTGNAGQLMDKKTSFKRYIN
jgi:hypothetical protein